MIILNTTFVTEPGNSSDLLAWVKRAYQESALKAGASNPVLTRILGDNGSDAESYALHLSFPDLESAQKWNNGVGQSLRNIMTQRWGERALAFHTYLEVL